MPSRPRPAVRAIFFDAGNTLLRMDYPAIAAALATHGRAVTPEAIQRAEWRARVRLDDTLQDDARRGSTESSATAGRYVVLILEELGIADQALTRAMADWRAAFNPPVGPWNTPEPAATAALELARRSGLTAGVISNSNGSVRGILDALGLTRHVDFVLDSSEVGMEKPDPGIFRLALDRAGVAAAEAVHVGDLYSVDVLGARGAGLDAVLVDPGGYWEGRDCLTARDVLAAVELVLARYSSGSVTNG